MTRVFQIDLQLPLEDPRSWTAEAGIYVAGSAHDCDWNILSESVAPKHARLCLESERILVEDLASQTGTLVNGYDISDQVEVPYPATIQLGPAILSIKEVTSPAQNSEASETKSKNLFGLTFLGSAAADFLHSDSSSTPSARFVRNAGTQVHYALEKEIAAGGMGLIYRGEDAHLDREVAVKVSRSGEGMDPRFVNEAKVLALLAHPNIVPIHAMGCDEDGFPFYSMKLVKGRSLQDILDSLREGDLETRRAYRLPRLLSIFQKVCDGMAFAHSKGVLHRDLKPDNVMVGEFGEVLVMDWGLAKLIAQKELPEARAEFKSFVSSKKTPTSDFGTTMDGEVMGTPQFMSPEQAQGRVAELDFRSDIYSLGGILFAILTLRPPVEAETLEELLTKVRTGVLTPMEPWRTTTKTHDGRALEPWPRNTGIPDALQAVTRKAMSLDRELRYRRVEELEEEIAAYLSGHATEAEGAGPMRQLYLMMKRHKVASTTLAAAIAGGIAFTLRLIASERAAEASAQRALEEKQRARETATVAHIALAEAAERDSDGEEMQRILAEVPEDLRDQKWEYLSKKLNSSDLNVVAKDGLPWMAITPDPKNPGKFITLQPNGWIRSLDLKNGHIADLWKVNATGMVDVLAVSKDGSKLALVHNSREVKRVQSSRIEVFEISTQKRLCEITLPPSGAFRLLFSPDGTSILCESRTADQGSQRFQMWAVPSGQLLWERNPSGTLLGEFSEDGKAIRLLSDREGVLELDARSGQLIRSLAKVPFPAGSVSSTANWLFAASPNWTGTFIFQNSPAKFLRKFDPVTGKLMFENRMLEAKGLGYLQGTGTLVSLAARSDRCVLLQYWHGQSGMLLKTIPILGGLKGGWKLAVHPNTDDVAVINGNSLRVWHFNFSKPEQTFTSIGSQFAFLSTPGRLARFSKKEDTWLLDTLQIGSAEFDRKPIQSLSFPSLYSPLICKNQTGDQVAIFGKPMSLYRVKQGVLSEALKQDISVTGRHFQLSPSGHALWTGDAIYDTASGAALCRMQRTEFEFPPVGMGASRWLDNGRVAEIAMLKADWPGAPEDAVERGIVVWDAQTGDRIFTLDTPDAFAIEASPDGQQLAEAGNDQRIRIRNSWTLDVEQEFRAHDGPVTALAWHPRMPFLVTASEDLTVRIWDLGTGRMLEELRGFASQPEHHPEVLSISPDGTTLIIQSGPTMGVYHPKTFRPPPQKPAAKKP